MPHVLIVFTHRDHAEVPAVVCEGADLTCSFASEGEARATVLQQPPDLILLAVDRPVAMARDLRACSPGAPMIVITHPVGEREQQALHAEGVSAVIFRPYSIQTLSKALTDLVRAVPST